MLVKAGLNRDDTATPSSCLYLLLNVRKDSLVAMLSKLQKLCFGMLGEFSLSLTDNEKNVLCKGLNFSAKAGLIEYSEFLPPFELLFCSIKREDLCNKDMSLIKAKLLNTALTSYQNFSSDRDPLGNLTSEFKALKRLSRNKDMVIQKADKGKTVVILDKCSYISAIEEILNDSFKFSKRDIPAGKDINHLREELPQNSSY